MTASTAPIQLTTDQITEDLARGEVSEDTKPLGWKPKESQKEASAPRRSHLEDSLDSLVRLVANITESYCWSRQVTHRQN